MSTATNTSTTTSATTTTYGPPLALAVVAISLAIATEVSSSENQSWQLLVILSVIGKISAWAAALEWWIDRKIRQQSSQQPSQQQTAVPQPQTTTNKQQQQQQQQQPALPDRSGGLASKREAWFRQLVVGPSVSLSLLLFVRLLAIDHFSTDPAALDFGPKYGDLTNDAEANSSFGGGSSFGHWVQGFIATFFAYSSLLTLRLGGPRWVSLLMECAAFAGCGYPLYNFIKRMLRTPETLATSSYMNNGCEWALGAMVGLSMGMALVAMAKLWHWFQKSKQNNNNSNSDDEESHHYQSASDNPNNNKAATTTTTTPLPTWANLLVGLFRMLGGLFALSVLAACAMTGYTWNNCLEEDGDQCGNYGDEGMDIALVVGLGMIPIIVSVMGMARSRPLVVGMLVVVLVGAVVVPLRFL